MTKQLQTEVEYIPQDTTGLTGGHIDENIDVTRQGFWRVKINAMGFNPIQGQKELTILFDKPITYRCHVTDEYNNFAEWYGLTSQATVFNNGADKWYYSFPAESNRFNGLNGKIIRYIEFPPRIIPGVVLQTNLTTSRRTLTSDELIAKGIAQGISIMTQKIAKLEFK